MNAPIPFNDFKREYAFFRDEVDRAVAEVLQGGWYILGKELESFEREFADYCGVPFGIGVGSGTEAIHLALLACDVQPGDEVITVPNTAVPTVSAVSFAQAKPVFVDVDPLTYTMDPNHLEDVLKRRFRPSASSGRPKVVLPVHLFGHPADLDSILEVSNRYGLKVVEDACQAHGALYRGKTVGTIGDAGAFSFYPTKNLGAYGDAGMVVTKSEDVARTVDRLRNYGEDRKFHNVIKGFNSRLDEIQAAVLRVKLKHLEARNTKRRRLARLYSEGLKSGPVEIPTEKDYARHVFHLYVVRSGNRENLQDHLSSHQVGSSIHYPTPIHLQPAYRDLGYDRGDFPSAERAMSEILSLPLHPEMTENEVARVVEVINEIPV